MRPYKMSRTTEKFVQEIKKTMTVLPTGCRLDCPERNCSQFSGLARLHGGTKAKTIFLLDYVATEDEAQSGYLGVGPAGRYLHANFIRVATGKLGGFGYALLPVRRSSHLKDPPDFDGPAAKLCWSFLYRDLTQLKPETLVVFSVDTFRLLVGHAQNAHELPQPADQTMLKLHGRFFPMDLGPLGTVDVFFCLAPEQVMRNPSAGRFFLLDRDAFIRRYLPSYVTTDQTFGKIEIQEIQLLRTEEQCLGYLDHLRTGLRQPTVLVFDTETRNLNRRHNNAFLTWQFCHQDGKAVVLPIEHPGLPLFAAPEAKERLVRAATMLFNSTPEQTNIQWMIGHNIKFDLETMYGLLGILVRMDDAVPWWCSMLVAHWLDENRKSVAEHYGGRPYGLKAIGAELFGFKYRAEHLEAREEGALTDLSIEDLAEYGGSDVILNWHLYWAQRELASMQPDHALEKLDRFVRRYFWPASRAMAIMEVNGLHTSQSHVDYMAGLQSPIWNRMYEIQEHEIQQCPEVLHFRRLFADRLMGKKKHLIGGVEFRQESIFDDIVEPPKVYLNRQRHQRAFYLDYLGAKPFKETDAGQPSLDKKFLAHYADPTAYRELAPIKQFSRYDGAVDQLPKNPLQLDLEYREMKKLGGYMRDFGRRLRDPGGDCVDGRIRASFHLSGTDTGRLSSSSPNLQQLPTRGKHAKVIKNVFQAEPGCVLIQADYKTAEVRWGAIFSGDENLTRVFREARDILVKACQDDTVDDQTFKAAQLASDLHRRTASLMFNLPPEQVGDQMRQASKSITFGLMFGMDVKTLAANNGWTIKEGEEKLALFFAAFPQLHGWLTKIPDVAKRQGYVETVMGRRRRLGHLFATGQWKHQGDGDRRAMNSPIQGQSSDAGVLGVCNFISYTLDRGLEQRWLLQNIVHDSCLIQTPLDELREALPVIEHCLVDGMRNYIEQHWDVTLRVPIEAEFEIGLQYGALHKWDGRPKSLDALVAKLADEAQKLWSPQPKRERRPPPILDLVSHPA